MKILLTLLTGVLFTLGQNARAEVRALWVTRWDYTTEKDVVAIMENAAAYGFNTVLFQVRGSATVFYSSTVEPWSWRLTSDSPQTTGKNPGWDPLAVAVREAHRRTLQIHAYLNALPGWRGLEVAPKRSGQIWSVHPDWFMVDSVGKIMQPTEKWYNFLSPHHPEARAHLKRVFTEVAANYKIDGIHLDYFRFPADYPANKVYPKTNAKQLKKHKNFSYDKSALRSFRKFTGKRPSQDPAAWDQFRRKTLTDLLREIHSAVLKERPSLIVSCAVVADPKRAHNVYFQDSTEWLKKGLLDLVFPMLYSKKTFDKYLSAYCTAIGEKWVGRVAAGIHLKQSAKELRREMTLVRKRRMAGAAFFAYSSLFKNHTPTEKAKAVKAILTAHL